MTLYSHFTKVHLKTADTRINDGHITIQPTFTVKDSVFFAKIDTFLFRKVTYFMSQTQIDKKKRITAL